MWKLSLDAAQKDLIARLEASREVWQTSGAYDAEQYQEPPAVRSSKGALLRKQVPHAAHAPWKPPKDRPSPVDIVVAGEPEQWSVEAGLIQWYLYDLNTTKIVENPAEIIELIRCAPDTPRHCVTEQEKLKDVRKKIEKHVKDTHLKKMQAPVGIKPTLNAWMEIS